MSKAKYYSDYIRFSCRLAFYRAEFAAGTEKSSDNILLVLKYIIPEPFLQDTEK